VKKNLILTSALVLVTMSVAHASLIMYEGFNYAVPSTSPDPDGGLNGGNGLPATNVGGTPSGTSTGFRGNWGTTTNVVAGLTYGSLLTTGGAARINVAGWSSTATSYRFITSDPFLSNRVVANGAFGVDGQSLYFSLLANSSSATAAAFSFALSGSTNVFVENTATTWTLNNNKSGAVASTGSFAINTTALLVIRADFAPGATDTLSLWVNPTIGSSLGTPNATIAGTANFTFNQLTTRSEVANAMTFDEFRMGTTFAAVTPIPEPSAFAALAGFAVLGLAATRRRRSRQ